MNPGGDERDWLMHLSFPGQEESTSWRSRKEE